MFEIVKVASKGRKIAIAVGVPLLFVVAVACVGAARYIPTIRPNTFVGEVPIGGLTPDDAAKKVREWWLTVKVKPLHVVWTGHNIALGDFTPSQLDTTIDDRASVADAPVDNALTGAEHAIGQGNTDRTNLVPKFKAVGVSVSKLAHAIEAAGKPQPAKFYYDGTKVYAKPEDHSGYTLDAKALPAAVADAILKGADVTLPVVSATPKVGAAVLDQITDQVSVYTTHFPVRQFNRNNNIKVASGKLNGIVLMPGDRLSFNETVGKRTVNGGFMEAPVYKNGKHDRGIGGGICQVSSTLYNACLLGDLKIVRRSNHSMPVAYVPLGRDATVDYGSIDLVVENNYSTPIAVVSNFTNGSLTFRVLGKRDPDLSVKIERVGQRDWDQGTEFVNNPKLAPGKTVTIERGSTGHSISTYRLIYKAGKLVRRESLGQSYYRPEQESE